MKRDFRGTERVLNIFVS